MAVNFNLLAREGPTNLYEGFERGQQAAAQNALAQQKMAQERELGMLRRQEFQANIESAQAERRRKTIADKTAMFRDRLLRASTPQAARELVKLQHSDPDLGPVIQQFGSLEQDLNDVPDDPAGFESWRQREAVGAAEFIKSQASERGFQELLARARGGQPKPAAPEGQLVAAPIPSPTGVVQEIAPGGAVGAQTPLSYLQSQFGTPGGAAPNALAPAAATAAAPVTNVLAAPAGGGRSPAVIRAEMDALSMSNDPRAVRLVQTLGKEYEAALRGGQDKTPQIKEIGVATKTNEPVYFDARTDQQFTIGTDATGKQIRVPYTGGVNRATSSVTATATAGGSKLEGAEQAGKGAFNVKQYGEIATAARLAARTLPALDTQAKILDQGFTTGFGTEVKKAGASLLSALGVPEAEKFATDAQTFLAATQQAVLQRQLEQKGPQTEADAQRITQTGAQLGNTVNANRFIIDVAKAQLKRDMEQREFYDKWWSKNKTYEGAEDAWYASEGGKSLFDRPELKKYAAPAGARAPAAAPATAIPQAAINDLRAGRGTDAQFDAIFGAGAAKRAREGK